MPRYRKLYTKTVESMDVHEMPDDFTRLTWVLLPLALCREGRGVDNTAWIKSKLFPLRTDVTSQMLQDAFDFFASRGMIERYKVDGRGYFYIPTWTEYQGVTTREADSIYPAPPEKTNSRVTHEQVKSISTHDEYCILNIESESTVESESIPIEEEDSPDPTTPMGMLEIAYLQYSKNSIDSSPRAIQAYQRMIQASVIPDDIKNGIANMDAKEFIIAGPWSIEKFAISACRQRLNKEFKSKPKDYNQGLKDYGIIQDQ